MAIKTANTGTVFTPYACSVQTAIHLKDSLLPREILPWIPSQTDGCLNPYLIWKVGGSLEMGEATAFQNVAGWAVASPHLVRVLACRRPSPGEREMDRWGSGDGSGNSARSHLPIRSLMLSHSTTIWPPCSGKASNWKCSMAPLHFRRCCSSCCWSHTRCWWRRVTGWQRPFLITGDAYSVLLVLSAAIRPCQLILEVILGSGQTESAVSLPAVLIRRLPLDLNAVGFSAVLFGLKVSRLFHRSPATYSQQSLAPINASHFLSPSHFSSPQGRSQPLHGGLEQRDGDSSACQGDLGLKNRCWKLQFLHSLSLFPLFDPQFLCWAELLVASFFNPRASFLGHLTGIVAGFIHVKVFSA